MSDTLSAIRRAIHSSQAAERRKLRHKMQPYNTLSRKQTGDPQDYDAQSAKTTQDVIAETLSLASNRDKRRRAPVAHDSTDTLLRECNVVSPEIREAWRARIGMSRLLSDSNRIELQQQSGASALSTLRECKLNDLAKWMIWMWCEGEGYDPEKHPKQAR